MPAETLPADGRPRHPERPQRGSRRRARGRLPEQADRRPAPEPARRVLREPDHLQAGEAPGRRPGQPRRHRCRGSIIDGGAFGGDGPVATDWYARSMPSPGPATRTSTTARSSRSSCRAAAGTHSRPSYSATTAPTIDGFDLRGGDQMGFPGQPVRDRRHAQRASGGLITQGGAIFANAYARNLQITNNVVQNNGGAYGTIRIGTPDLGTDTDNQNDAVRIMNNRIIANGGTNLAGGDRHLRRRRRLRGPRQRHLRQLLGRVRRRPDPPTGCSPNGSIDHNRDLLQPVVRRGRRDHDRRPAADGSLDPLARLRARSPSTTTWSRRTSPTTMAAASGS